VRDGLKRLHYTADLSGLVTQPGCTISVPAVYACLPSDKTNVHPTPPQEGVGDPTGGFACYRVRCPKAALPPIVIEDQFGTRPATPNVTRMVCAPLGPTSVVTNTTTTLLVTTTTAAATTSTTTTIIATTTTTLPLACPYVGPPVFNPATYPACSPACAGAHCVPSGILPAGDSTFAACTGGVCAPDPVIAAAGNYVPPSCDAFPGTGAPGRCLSPCLPLVAAMPGIAPSTCSGGDLCAPCFDPYTGAPTGACSTSCDTPPATPFKFPGCCHDGTAMTGTCVPPSQIPDGDEDSFTQLECPSAQYLCVPNEYLPGGTASTCDAGILGPGACVSLCVDNSALAFLSQGTCHANHVCAPCAAFPTAPGCAAP
jgi:hypothetical protein